MKKINLLILFSILGSFIFAQKTAALTSKESQSNGNVAIVANEKHEPCFKLAEECFYKNLVDFCSTFDNDNKVHEEIRSKAYCLYLDKDWANLELLFNQEKLNSGWPPANGGYNVLDEVELKAGMKFDRFGAALYFDKELPILGGNFTSPYIDGKAYSFEARALNKKKEEYDFYYEIEILKDLEFKGQEAAIIPWFKQEGNGKQVMWKIPVDEKSGYPKTWNALAEEGWIKITILDTPSGTHKKLKNTVIQKK